MKLKQLRMTRQDWGDFKDQVTGSITFEGLNGEVTMHLSPENCQKILIVCAAQLTEQSHKLATALADETYASVVALPKPTQSI